MDATNKALKDAAATLQTMRIFVKDGTPDDFGTPASAVPRLIDTPRILEDFNTESKDATEAFAKIDRALKLLEGDISVQEGWFGENREEAQKFVQGLRNARNQLAETVDSPTAVLLRRRRGEIPIPEQNRTLEPNRGSAQDPRIQGSGSAITPSALNQTFDGFIRNFERSFSSQSSLFGTNLIENLNTAFTSLRGPVSEFRLASETFINKLNEFNNRGGIRGPNIPDEVAVAVRFDDDITVAADSSGNSDLLNQIGVLVADSVREELNKLRVFG